MLNILFRIISTVVQKAYKEINMKRIFIIQ